VFAWREPGRAAFFEVKVGLDRIKPTQVRFVKIALRFRRLEDFMIVEVAGPSQRRTPAGQPGTTAGQASARRPAGRVSAAGTCSLRSVSLSRPRPVTTRPGSSGPGARRGGPRTT
jgi:hypothetical protein